MFVDSRRLIIGTSILSGVFGLFSYGHGKSMIRPIQNTPIRPTRSQFNKTVLITGANRGLGKLISKKMSEQGWEVYLTARNADLLSSEFKRDGINYKNCIDWDLCAPPSQEKIDQIFAELPNTISAVVHCASPYMKTSLLESSPEKIVAYSNAMQNDILFSKAAADKLKTSGNNSVLAITGAVVGLPNYFSLGMMGLLKANQRQLAGVLEQELKSDSGNKVHVRHFDLGTFVDEVTDPYKQISTEFVADTIIAALNKPLAYPHEIHLLSRENENYFNVKSTEVNNEVSHDTCPNGASPGKVM